MCPDCLIEFEAPHAVEVRRKSRSHRKHGQWNSELIPQIGIVFSRAWPVKTCGNGKCFSLYFFFVLLKALIKQFSSAALCL